MESTPAHLRWSLWSCLVQTLLFALLILGAVQVQHRYAMHATKQTAQVTESSCSLVPVSDDAAPASINVVCL